MSDLTPELRKALEAIEAGRWEEDAQIHPLLRERYVALGDDGWELTPAGRAALEQQT